MADGSDSFLDEVPGIVGSLVMDLNGKILSVRLLRNPFCRVFRMRLLFILLTQLVLVGFW